MPIPSDIHINNQSLIEDAQEVIGTALNYPGGKSDKLSLYLACSQPHYQHSVNERKTHKSKVCHLVRSACKKCNMLQMFNVPREA